MAIKDIYYIKKIEYKLAMDMVVTNHYLHRKTSCSYSFGLFETDTDKLIGTIVYGIPASRQLQKGICGPDEANNVIEITRIWIEDSTPRNVESYLIGNTLKLVPKDIVVSYAETDVGHIGYIYQATNFIYTGLSDRHVLWIIPGMANAHSRHLFDSYGGINKAHEALGDKMVATERPRKHRYIYFNCNKTRKKELIGKLRYRIQDYPKLNKYPTGRPINIFYQKQKKQQIAGAEKMKRKLK